MLALIRPILPYVIMAIIASLGVSGVYLYVRQQGVMAEREAYFRREAKQFQLDVAKANEVSAALEEKLASSQAEARKINERLNNELNKEPIYRECIVPDSGVQLLNDARSSINSAR